MVITRQGDGYLKLQSGKTTILVDPTDERSFKGATLALFTEEGDEEAGLKEESQIFLIRHAGEYEVGGIDIRGWQVDGHTVYAVTFDEIRFVLLGTVKALPGAEAEEHLGDADVAIVNGGKDAAGDVARLMRQLEPSIVIPLYAKDVKPFLKEFGVETCPAEDKLVFKKSDLEKGSMNIQCLA